MANETENWLLDTEVPDIQTPPLILSKYKPELKKKFSLVLDEM